MLISSKTALFLQSEITVRNSWSSSSPQCHVLCTGLLQMEGFPSPIRNGVSAGLESPGQAEVLGSAAGGSRTLWEHLLGMRAAWVFLQPTEITGEKRQPIITAQSSRKRLICIWAQAFSIRYLSGVPICKCGTWQFCHPKPLNTMSCFTERSGWWCVSETLDMFKASDSLLQEGSFGSVWPFIVASWDTLRCCHEMTLPGVAG